MCILDSKIRQLLDNNPLTYVPNRSLIVRSQIQPGNPEMNGLQALSSYHAPTIYDGLWHCEK
jgi:hypothetical protein